MTSLKGGLLDLVRELDQLGSDATLVALGQILQRVDLTPEDIQEFTHATPQRYNRVPVVVRDHYELVVMTYLPGQASSPQDRLGSIWAIRVLQGEAIEGCYHLAPDGYAELLYETTIRPGQVLVGQDAGVHAFRNSATKGELLVMIHVYSPSRDCREYRCRPMKGSPQALPAITRLRPTIMIIGGGFSGTMTAAQILRRAKQAKTPIHVVLVERRGAIGEGVAYSTQDEDHLLNVYASRMSAWPDEPNDFVRWASQRQVNVRANDFLPRRWYGDYIRETLLQTSEQTDNKNLTIIFDEARRVVRHPTGGWMVHFAHQSSLQAEAVILAIGHRPPADPIRNRWVGPKTRLIEDPWRPLATNIIRPEDPVVILGSGLTAVDMVISLRQQPRQAPITLLSRHGFLPQIHVESPIPPIDCSAMVSAMIAAPGGVRIRALLHQVRRMVNEATSNGHDWRGVVDGLRPHTATLWQAMALPERQRFLARLRPFWEVHRHRMAPTVGRRLHALLECGEVQLIAGSIESANANVNHVNLVINQRAGTGTHEVCTSWVVNCTGPLPSNSVSSNSVIGSLLTSGLLRPDPLSIGIDTTSNGNVLSATGEAVLDLYLVGTLRKPTNWESTAVPELRQQAANIAENVLRLCSRKA